MKTFKGVVFASIVFDVYLPFINDVIKGTQYSVFEKGADLHKEHFLSEQCLKCNY